VPPPFPEPPGVMVLANFILRYVNFQINFNIAGSVVLYENMFKDFSTFPYCGPNWPPGDYDFYNLILHYIWMLPCNRELLWFSGSWEENF
jgi:hypothetical protein